ncbi:MAG: hypothetical protein A2583_02140 [Bdellovibrionales bacterium RIFOXYD1_FULL_53_11]|nr:MAG: hypothetical protein A2583_02140 [Bdellovibrionales bacterium RIFOXYD1_FULL_53_11]
MYESAAAAEYNPARHICIFLLFGDKEWTYASMVLMARLSNIFSLQFEHSKISTSVKKLFQNSGTLCFKIY